jgi:hypothetical protein
MRFILLSILLFFTSILLAAPIDNSAESDLALWKPKKKSSDSDSSDSDSDSKSKSKDDDRSDSSDSKSKFSGLLKGISGSFASVKGGTGSKVRTSIRNIDEAVKALGVQIDAFDGDSFKALELMTSADKIIKMIQDGTKETQEGKEISFVDGLGILPLFRKFIPDTRKAMDSVLAKKDLFDKAEVTSVVLDKLNKIKDAGRELDDAVVEKLDTISKPFGKAAYAPINKAIGKGIDGLASGTKSSSSSSSSDSDSKPADDTPAPAPAPAPAADADADAPAKEAPAKDEMGPMH